MLSDVGGSSAGGGSVFRIIGGNASIHAGWRHVGSAGVPQIVPQLPDAAVASTIPATWALGDG